MSKIMTGIDFYFLLKEMGIQVPEENRGIIIQAYMEEPVKIFFEGLGTPKLAIVINEETAGRMMVVERDQYHPESKIMKKDAKDGPTRTNI